MKTITTTLASLAALLSAGAFAQSGEVQRNENQQERIEQGLQSGQLTTKEAAKLEKKESRVEKDESRAMRNGAESPREKARIQAEQDKLSHDIARDKSNARTGNPDSASSQRLQADVQRNANQQQRIEQGVQSGQLTTHEAGRLEKDEARVERREGRAASNGKVSAGEQRRIQRTENRDSRRIHRKKHNARQEADKSSQ